MPNPDIAAQQSEIAVLHEQILGLELAQRRVETWQRAVLDAINQRKQSMLWETITATTSIFKRSKSDTEVLAAANSQLTLLELTRKAILAQAQLQESQQRLNALKEYKNSAVARLCSEIQAETELLLRHDVNGFFYKLWEYSNIKTPSAGQQLEIIFYANNIKNALALSNSLEDNWLALRFLNRTQKILQSNASLIMFTISKIFTMRQAHLEISEQCVQTMLLQLPVELQPLKVLVLHGEYAIIEGLIVQYLSVESQQPVNKQKLLQFMQGFIAKIDTINKQRANSKLTVVPGFESLAAETKKVLIQQQAYVTMLQAYKIYAGGQPVDPDLDRELTASVNLLEANINAAIENHNQNIAVLDKLKADFKAIMAKLAAREQEVRDSKRMDSIKMPAAILYTMLTAPSDPNLKVSPITTALLATDLLSTVYVCYRNGWFPMLGAGVLNLGMKQALLASYAADRMEFPEFAAERAVAGSMREEDYAFLRQQAALWDLDGEPTQPHVTQIPPRQVKVEHGFNPTGRIADKVMVAAKENFETQIRQGEDFYTTAVDYKNLTKAIAIDVGITATGILVVTTAVLFPVLLSMGLGPVGVVFLATLVPAVSLAVIGAAAVIAARLALDNGSLGMWITDKAVEIAYIPLDLILRVRDFILVPFMPSPPNVVADIKAKHKAPVASFTFDPAGMARLKTNSAQLHAAATMLEADFRLYEQELHADLQKIKGVQERMSEESRTATDLSQRLLQLQQLYMMINNKLIAEEPLNLETLEEIFKEYLQDRARFVKPRYIAAAQARNKAMLPQPPVVSQQQAISTTLTFTSPRDRRPSFAMQLPAPQGKPEYQEFLSLRDIRTAVENAREARLRAAFN